MELEQEIVVTRKFGRVVKVPKEEVQSAKCNEVFHEVEDLNNHRAYHKESFLAHAISAQVSIKRVPLHSCERCTKTFIDKEKYILHRIRHLRDIALEEKKLKNEPHEQIEPSNVLRKPYECPNCDLAFVAKSTLQEHSILHLPFPNICDCGIGYYKKQDLILHRKLVHVKNKQKRKQKDGKSGKKSNEPKGKFKKSLGPPNPVIKRLREELNVQVLEDGRAVCPTCNKVFKEKYSVYTHYVKHTGELPYKCSYCDKAYTQVTNLNIHVRNVHEHTNIEFSCRVCNKSFISKENRDRHELIHGEKTRECPYCHKAFHDASALIRHKRIHTGDKRYKCPLCPKAFTDISGLNGHKLLRHGKKEFKCEICDKMFFKKDQLTKHLIVHSNVKKYICDYCNRCFALKEYLVLHIKRHMYVPNAFSKPENKAEKKYKCSEYECVFATAHKSNLKRHYRKVHNYDELITGL